MQSSYHCTCRCVKQRAYRRCLPQTRAYCRCLLQATGGRGCARDSADLWGRVLWSWSSAKITRGISLQTYSSSSWELSIWVHICTQSTFPSPGVFLRLHFQQLCVAIEKIRPHSEVAKNWRPESGQEITTSNAWTQYMWYPHRLTPPPEPCTSREDKLH